MAEPIGLPDGFELDAQPTSLPEGFQLDAQEVQPQPAMQETVQPVQQEIIQPPSNQIAPPIDLKGAIQDRLSRIVSDIPRAGSVAARNVLEGVGGMVDFVGSPIRAAVTAAGHPDPGGFLQKTADYLDLEKPQPGLESVVSEAEKILAGGGGMLGAASKAAGAFKAGTTAQTVAKSLAAAPEIQGASMVGSGLAGGTVKEAGGGPWEQLAAAVAGGLGAGGIAGLSKKASTAMTNIMKKTPDINIKIDTVINSALKSKGIEANKISSSIRNQLQKDMKEALDLGDLSPDAVKRLVDYRLTGTTPTAGPITLDPGIVTKQQNLAKMGAASKDPNLQKLSTIASENEKRLVENLNNMGAGTVDDQIATAERVMESLAKTAKTAKGKIDPLYTKARDTVGRSAHLDPRAFTQRASDLLDEKLLGSKLPVDIKNKLNSIAKGETPLTVDVAEQLKTNMAMLSRKSKDGAERMAIAQVRNALEETPLLEGQGKAAIAAFNVARKANREWMQVVEKTPALKAVMDGVEPDKFMNTFILGQGKDASIKSVSRLKAAIKDDPGALSIIKNNISQYIKEKALGGASDEVGRFSPSNYNKTLKAIGDRKLNMFFTPEEFSMLKAVGRVASYEKAQPTGSAVNNSNTASSAISGVLDWIGQVQLLRRLPLGGMVGDQAKSITQNISATKSLNIPNALSVAKQTPQKIGVGIAPFAAAGVLKETAQSSDNKRR